MAGTVCENMDCIKVIKKYGGAGRKTLFYSDSPYVATADYEDDKQGIVGFGADKMEELIKALGESGKKFIFSCRAVKNFLRGENTTKKIEEANRKIMGGVHEKFSEYFLSEGKPLFVLAIEEQAALVRKNGEKVFAPIIRKKNKKALAVSIRKKAKKALSTSIRKKAKKDLAALIRENKVAEIMITNFKICDFEDKNHCPKTRFQVYTFKKFMEIVKKNANGIK